MTKDTERKYLTIGDIQREYLPISKKKIRELVKKHTPVKLIGGRIYVERVEFEAFLSDGEGSLYPMR